MNQSMMKFSALMAAEGSWFSYQLLILFGVFVVIAMATVWMVRRVPKNKVLVKYGNLGKKPDGTYRSHACYLEGSFVFVKPLIQAYQFLDVTIHTIAIDLNAFSQDEVAVHLGYSLRYRISKVQPHVSSAAERLLGVSQKNIDDLVKDIACGQIRVVFSQIERSIITPLNQEVQKKLVTQMQMELDKIGIEIIALRLENLQIES